MLLPSWGFIPCPNRALEGHPLSAVRDYLFSTFVATLRINNVPEGPMLV